MSADNPYAPPKEANPFADPPLVAQADAEQGHWRDGRILVMHKLAQLPARCVKSNQPTELQLKRSLSWHPPWVFVLILASILIYIIVALVIRKTAKINIGLSDRWLSKRRRAMAIGWGSVVVGIGLMVAGVQIGQNNDAGGWLFLLAVIVVLVGLIFGVVRARMVTPTKITNNFVWLKGVHPKYLEELPVWPGYES